MKLGVTGTRDGWTPKQEELFTLLVRFIEPTVFYHGDCIGVDAQASEVVAREVPTAYQFALPSNVPGTQANRPANYRAPARSPLTRNQTIVLSTDMLIVVPSEMDEVLRSGTWSTYRFAKQRKKRVLVILPDGTLRC